MNTQPHRDCSSVAWFAIDDDTRIDIALLRVKRIEDGFCGMQYVEYLRSELIKQFPETSQENLPPASVPSAHSHPARE